MKIGILTGGGDCPGLNPVIRAIVRKGVMEYEYEFVGILYGWKGMMEKITTPLDLKTTSGILHRGGTILGTSRTNPYKGDKDGEAVVLKNFKELGLDALIAIGGDDTLGVASKLFKAGLNTVGVPKTIDNDLSATDTTFGFDTAVQIATDAIDRLHSTAESHNRVIVCEVMGRHAGWIAIHAGLAGGADVTLIPEKPFDINEVCQQIKKRHARGKNFSIVVVAEGALPKDGSDFYKISNEVDEFGHVRLGGIAEAVAKQIEKITGYETRTTTLGHIQRGGTPTAYDRILGTKYGLCAIDMVHNQDFGKMAALSGSRVIPVPLEDAVKENKTVDEETYKIAQVFFG